MVWTIISIICAIFGVVLFTYLAVISYCNYCRVAGTICILLVMLSIIIAMVSFSNAMDDTTNTNICPTCGQEIMEE